MRLWLWISIPLGDEARDRNQCCYQGVSRRRMGLVKQAGIYSPYQDVETSVYPGLGAGQCPMRTARQCAKGAARAQGWPEAVGPS